MTKHDILERMRLLRDRANYTVYNKTYMHDHLGWSSATDKTDVDVLNIIINDILTMGLTAHDLRTYMIDANELWRYLHTL